MLEHKRQKLATPQVFIGRMLTHVGIAGLLIGTALLIGVTGYHNLAGLGWVDSLLEASMILSGMGPVYPLSSMQAKIFASGYALFSGLVFIAVMGIVFAPVLHRILHKFHIDE